MKLLKVQNEDEGGTSLVYLPFASIDAIEHHLDEELTGRVSIYTRGGASFCFKPGAHGNPTLEAVVSKLAAERGDE